MRIQLFSNVKGVKKQHQGASSSAFQTEKKSEMEQV